MVNGYYCGHFGENMTIAELEAGILWHYEGGCNLLKNSTAFPPEPIPRPENLPADMPWYGKETTEEPDPYIFDGYMSVEDYEKRQQLIAADQARSDPLPDESPPEHQHTELTIQIGPPVATVLLDALADAMKAAARAVRQLMDELAERFRRSSGNTHEKPWTLLWTPYYIEPTPTRNGGTYTNTHGNGEPGRNTSGCL